MEGLGLDMKNMGRHYMKDYIRNRFLYIDLYIKITFVIDSTKTFNVIYNIESLRKKDYESNFYKILQCKSYLFQKIMSNY